MNNDPIAVLATATGVKQKKNEDAQVYYQRLVAGVAELSDEEWNKLPREAQDWYNAAAEEVNQGKPVSTPDGKESTAGDASADADAGDAKEEDPDATAKKVKPISAARKAREEKRAADKAAKEAPVVTEEDKKKPPAKDGPSPTGRARELMMLDADITSAQVRDQLQKEGYPLPALSSLQAMRSDTRSSLAILQKAGRLKAAAKG